MGGVVVVSQNVRFAAQDDVGKAGFVWNSSKVPHGMVGAFLGSILGRGPAGTKREFSSPLTPP